MLRPVARAVLPLSFRLVIRDAAVARQHALDVAVQYRAAFVLGQRADRGGGGTADAGQFEYLFELARKFAVMFFDDDLRGAMQVAAARVIAEAAPVREHLLFGRGGECGDGRERCDEALVIGDDGGDLRLLQHDLGQPHTVGIRALPGQVVAAVRALPGDQA